MIKSNPLVRGLLRRALKDHISVRSMRAFPLKLAFPADKHFNLFFTRKVTYEPACTQLLQQHLRPGDVFFDVGANIGIFSVIAAHLVGMEGQVHAFEPDPQNIPWLWANVHLNAPNAIEVHTHGVGATASTASFYQDTTTTRTSSFVADTWSPDAGAKQVIQIDVKPLDDYADQIERLDFVKIDVEGFEYEALSGAAKLIQQYQPLLLIELSRKEPETRALLSSWGYHEAHSGPEGTDEMSFFLPS